jgi:hypothetical protein
MLRTLFAHTDDVAANVRIRPLLEELSSSGRIRYASVDRNMAVTGARSDKYDVLLTHRNPSRCQHKWLKARSIRFVYDIDDLLLADDVRGVRRAAEQSSIQWCLENADAVTAPSRRLLAMLDRKLPNGLGARAIHLPNAGLERPPPTKAKSKPRFLWASSAQPMDAGDLDAVCLGISDAVQALNTDIVMIGRFPQRLLDFFPSRQVMEWLEPSAYLELLASGPFIAVAPLSLTLPAAQQMFADCKSDIKIAQYGASRIAGAYSAALPFTESDLPCHIVPNTRADWAEALRMLANDFPDQGNRLADHPAFALRRPAVLAAQLHEVLKRTAEVTEPFSFWAISTPNLARTVEHRVRMWRSRFRRSRLLTR